MKSRDRKLLLICIAGILFVGWRVRGMLGGLTPAAAQTSAAPHAAVPAPESSAQSPAVAVDGQATGAAAPPVAAARAALIELQQGRARLNWGRNPFASGYVVAASQPGEPIGPAAPDWLLTGISQSGNRRCAILGGRVLMEGHRIDDVYWVASITDRQVTVRDDRFEHTFTLGEAGARTQEVGQGR